MVRDCHYFRKDGRCRFGDSCRYRHVYKFNRQSSKRNATQGIICERFISKDGCKGYCDKAHAFEEDTELLDMFNKGVRLTNICINDIEKIKEQIKLTEKFEEKEVYCLPSDTGSQLSQDEPSSILIPSNPGASAPTLTLESFLGTGDMSRYKNETHAGHVLENADSNGFHSNNSSSSHYNNNPTNGHYHDSNYNYGFNEIPDKKVVATPNFSGDEYEREVKQVERLYKDRCQVLKNTDGTLIQLALKPTDPDWSLTLLEINLDLFIPIFYPRENCCIEFYDERVSQSTIEAINAAIDQELLTRTGTMCVRPMLRWIDRNIEELLEPETQFHTHSSLKSYKTGDCKSDEEEEPGPSDEPPPRRQTTENSSDFLEKDQGSIVRLLELELHGSSHGITSKILLLLLQCLRCKCQAEVAVGANTSKSLICGRCSCVLSCYLYRKLCLTSASSLACADLVGCSLADVILPRSQVNAICARCSHYTGMSLQPGQVNTTWCTSCGAKISISFEGAKVMVINPPQASGKQKARKKEDKGYVEGQPLPDKGTCKHYKKSQRWFRFSCCNRLYPCDKCHDEAVPDCPLEQANRMVCGLCAKEQPMRNQCKFCHGEISGTIKTSHWEGGKGCRDRVRMSNADSRKHKNSSLKTHSQKDKRVGKKKDPSPPPS